MSRVLIVCWLLFNASYTFADVETKQTEGTGKKGACFSRQNDQWSYKISQLKANWYYSWGRELREGRPKNVEFVPMFWGKWFKDDDIEYLLNLKNQNQIKFVLGFNEPDSPDQSNMSVDEAIALWPKLEAIGLPLGSPATVNPENKWMINFMQKVDDLGLRVDFICVHHYGGKMFKDYSTNCIRCIKDTIVQFGSLNLPLPIGMPNRLARTDIKRKTY